MNRVTFTKVFRNDTARRCRIIINEDTAWMHFKPGYNTEMSVLWYFDVEFEGDDALPLEPQAARALFLDYSEQITTAITQVIDFLHTIEGALSWPASTDRIEVADGIKFHVNCAAIWRIDVRAILPEVIYVRDHWKEHIESLERVEASSKSTPAPKLPVASAPLETQDAS